MENILKLFTNRFFIIFLSIVFIVTVATSLVKEYVINQVENDLSVRIVNIEPFLGNATFQIYNNGNKEHSFKCEIILLDQEGKKITSGFVDKMITIPPNKDVMINGASISTLWAGITGKLQNCQSSQIRITKLQSIKDEIWPAKQQSDSYTY